MMEQRIARYRIAASLSSGVDVGSNACKPSPIIKDMQGIVQPASIPPIIPKVPTTFYSYVAYLKISDSFIYSTFESLLTLVDPK